MPTISHAYHAHSGNYTPGGNRCRYIVVHNTGNTAAAVAEARFAQNNQHPSSYHYVLDGTGTIYQILDDGDTAWAVGAWRGATQLIGNGESISIEVCSNGTPFTADEIVELHWLVRLLMERHGIPADRVVRHYDCHTGHKDCPAWYVDLSRWTALKAIITADFTPDDSEENMDIIVNPKGRSYMAWLHGDRPHTFAKPAEVTAVKNIYKAATGKDMATSVISAADYDNFVAVCKR